MTGFFLYSNGNRVEVRHCDDDGVNEVAIDVFNDGPVDYYTISISDPEDLDELIEFLNDCKDKLKFHKK